MFRSTILALGFVLLPWLVVAQNNPLATVKELKSEWLTVDRTAERYVPYINGQSLNYPVIGVMLQTDQVNGLLLRFCVQEGTSVFINNRIVDRITAAGCKYYDVDSLEQRYGNGTMFLSFFRPNLNPDLLSTTLMTTQPAGDLQVQNKPTQQITKRANNHFGDFFIVAIMVVFAFYAFLINRHPRGIRDFFNFSKAFSLTLKEEKVLTQRNMSTVNTLFLWMYGMILSLLIILFWKIFDAVPDVFGFVDLTTFWACIFSWLALSFIIFCVVELKYMLIKVLCSLLNVDKIAQIHFFDFIRLSLIFVGSTFLVASSLYLSNLKVQIAFTIVLYLFMALLGVRIIILLFKLIGDTSFRKIHLISYLCTTEILPLLIGIRIFF